MDKVLFATKGCSYIAEELVSIDNEKILESENNSLDLKFVQGVYDEITLDDGQTRFEIHTNLEDKDAIVICSFENELDWVVNHELIGVVKALARSVKIVVTYASGVFTYKNPSYFKKEVFSDWIESEDCLILTDNQLKLSSKKCDFTKVVEDKFKTLGEGVAKVITTDSKYLFYALESKKESIEASLVNEDFNYNTLKDQVVIVYENDVSSYEDVDRLVDVSHKVKGAGAKEVYLFVNYGVFPKMTIVDLIDKSEFEHVMSLDNCGRTNLMANSEFVNNLEVVNIAPILYKSLFE